MKAFFGFCLMEFPSDLWEVRKEQTVGKEEEWACCGLSCSYKDTNPITGFVSGSLPLAHLTWIPHHGYHFLIATLWELGLTDKLRDTDLLSVLTTYVQDEAENSSLRSMAKYLEYTREGGVRPCSRKHGRVEQFIYWQPGGRQHQQQGKAWPLGDAPSDLPAPNRQEVPVPLDDLFRLLSTRRSNHPLSRSPHCLLTG